jgi:uncharacterized secreted protein with C-terminal beta-propeller domain
MSIKYLKEITKWDGDIPNHTYMVDEKGNLVGYIKTGTKEEIIFKSPMKQFSKSHRKFIDLRRG